MRAIIASTTNMATGRTSLKHFDVGANTKRSSLQYPEPMTAVCSSVDFGVTLTAVGGFFGSCHNVNAEIIAREIEVRSTFHLFSKSDQSHCIK